MSANDSLPSLVLYKQIMTQVSIRLLVRWFGLCASCYDLYQTRSRCSLDVNLEYLILIRLDLDTLMNYI
jgi:hypothetical protein